MHIVKLRHLLSTKRCITLKNFLKFKHLQRYIFAHKQIKHSRKSVKSSRNHVKLKLTYTFSLQMYRSQLKCVLVAKNKKKTHVCQKLENELH